MVYLDDNKREIKHGDLIKIFHFKAARRRKVFMYKLVFATDDGKTVKESGKFLYAIDACDIIVNGFDKSYKCPLSVISSCEIIDNSFRDGECFWERKPSEFIINHDS